MIISMSDILCVTNRKLCRGYGACPEYMAQGAEAHGDDPALQKLKCSPMNPVNGENYSWLNERIFLSQIDRIAQCRPAGIILREKDLSEKEYRMLASQVLQICKQYGTRCILHSFADAALELGADALHLPLSSLRALAPEKRRKFRVLGASCHSAEDAREAQTLGCTYITAGHIFATDCKAGVPGRGLDFLREVCESVALPVFAIGGIRQSNVSEVRRAGAAGACVMSGCMQCDDAKAYLSGFAEKEDLHAPYGV